MKIIFRTGRENSFRDRLNTVYIQDIVTPILITIVRTPTVGSIFGEVETAGLSHLRLGVIGLTSRRRKPNPFPGPTPVAGVD